MAGTSPQDEPANSAESGRFGELRPVRAASSAPADPVAENEHAKVKRELHERLLAAIPADQIDRLSGPDLRAELHRLATELSQSQPEILDSRDQDALVDQVLDEVLGVGPLGVLMRQEDISEILINGPHQVFVERQGQLHQVDVAFRDEAHLVQVVQRLIAKSGRQLSRKTPMTDARLADGSRLNAVLNPPALNGPLVSIRRFGVRPLTVNDLLRNESLANEMLDFLAACVQSRVNIVISGGTGSGKTTLLNTLSRFIPSSERLVTIEDTAELELQQPHIAKMEAQPAALNGEGLVTTRDLVRNALRMRPDRIIVGECRGGEALDMMQAMNTGHEGSMTTVHANTAREALTRIELMIALAGTEIPVAAIRKLIASSIGFVVQVARLSDGRRKVVTISEITGLEGDVVSMHEIFGFHQTGMDSNRHVEGYFRATGVRPQCLKHLNVRGAAIGPDYFVERPLLPRPFLRTGR